jgi:predicted amidophosphoribosyltransferase
MTCKGICIRHKASGRYATGHKRCQQCDLFIEWDGLWCPCCGYKLRTRPRKFKLKSKLREQEVIEEAKKIKIVYHLQNV